MKRKQSAKQSVKAIEKAIDASPKHNRCDQCEALVINGVYCHETGCPNSKKTWVEDRQAWILFHPCSVCGCDVEVSKPAQLALPSKLDATAFPPNTIFFFTCNTVEGLEDRFLSRTRQIPFQSHGMAEQTASLLERIWQAEVGHVGDAPNFLRIVRDSQNNVRDALMSLETEILAA